MSLFSSDSRTWNLIEKFQLGDLDDSYMPVIRQLADDVAAQNLLTTNTQLFGTGPQAMTAAARSHEAEWCAALVQRTLSGEAAQ